MVGTAILKRGPTSNCAPTKLTDFAELWAFLLGKEDDNQTNYKFSVEGISARSSCRFLNLGQMGKLVRG